MRRDKRLMRGVGPGGRACLLVGLVVAASCKGESPGTVSMVADSIAAEILAGPPPVAGVTIAVRRGDDLILDRAYGLADVGAGTAISETRPLRIASLTKQFTAAAVLRLVDRGQLDLDAPIGEFLADFGARGRTITVGHLLNHTSGLPNYSRLLSSSGRAPAPRTVVLDTLRSHPLDSSPGEEYRYNNSNYYLLGVIIEAVTGRSYGEHLESEIFGPLQLADTRYCRTDSEQLLVGYRATADGLTAVELRDSTDYLGGSGGLCSTAADLTRWQRALASGDVITPAAYALMTSPTVTATGDTVPYGFGMDLEVLEGVDVVGHGGALAGFNGRIGYLPEQELSVAVLVNTNTAKALTIRDAVIRAALELPRVVPTDAPLTATERAQYIGTYDLGVLEVVVFQDRERLVLQPAGQAPARLLYQGDGTFVADVGAGVRIDFLMQSGRATRITLHQGARPLEGPRVEG